MTTVPPGARLTFRTSAGDSVLRALAEVPLTDQWVIPVLAAVGVPAEGLAGELELPTDRGVLRLSARLSHGDAGYALRPGLGAAERIQRRDDVRADVRLPLRALAEPPPPRLGRPVPVPDAVPSAAITVSLSAGGVGLRPDRDGDGFELAAGHRMRAELTLPDGRLVPVLLELLEARPELVRARFDRIEPGDRERLVRLVFEQQRRELAARRRLLEVWPDLRRG